jgi:hypothetical protein
MNILTNPLQTGGITTIQFSTNQIFWHNITSFDDGSKEQAWTPNVTVRVQVRVLWSTSLAGGIYSSNKTVSFTVDVTPPSLTILSPFPGSTVRTFMLSASWHGSDEIAGIDHYEIRIDNDPWINTGSNTTYTFKNVPDENHTISVKAIDKVSLSERKTVSFIINTTPRDGSEWTNLIIVIGLITAVMLTVGVRIRFLKQKPKIPSPPRAPVSF